MDSKDAGQVLYEPTFQDKNNLLCSEYPDVKLMDNKDAGHVLHEPLFQGKNNLLCGECPDV
jgi:hypothetical protein